MDQEATTPDSSVETTPPETSADTEGTAAVTDDSQETQDFDLKPEGVSLDSVPKELRAEVEKHVKEIEKGFKRAYTKKRQEESASVKTYESKLRELETQNSQWAQIANEILQDPSKLEAYRKVYGVETKPAEQPKFETVDDLVNYYENKLSNTSKVMEQKVQQTIQSKLQELQGMQRWDGALEIARQDPKFVKYEKLVTKLALEDPKYKQMYTGNNEKQILKAALDDFKALIREDLEEVKTQTLASLQKKKSASTMTPQKNVHTQGSQTGLSKEEIIARIRERIPS